MARLAARLWIVCLVAAGALTAPGPSRVAAAQQPGRPVEAVDFRPFTDGLNWIVKERLVYLVGVSKAQVVVPRGFVTDFASIPPALQSYIQQNGPYSLPAVVHDYLYWMQGCTREQADRLFRLAMIENRVPRATAEQIYAAVRLGGAAAWSSNAAARTSGLIRTLPETHISPPGLASWPAYQREMRTRKVSGALENPIDPLFCARGSMSESDALTRP
jgi:hypothetical protein